MDWEEDGGWTNTMKEIQSITNCRIQVERVSVVTVLLSLLLYWGYIVTFTKVLTI
jgi:hypothetical protein